MRTLEMKNQGVHYVKFDENLQEVDQSNPTIIV